MAPSCSGPVGGARLEPDKHVENESADLLERLDFSKQGQQENVGRRGGLVPSRRPVDACFYLMLLKSSTYCC